ncbi:DOPA 4,5-dioxygenase family protein [Brevibacillus sp. SYP-B805]|uniref:DUF6042 family protein n=1 Tax=Brevibacillus sp. SYP-B805 TaxID=1578199 RepID=UPI0013EC5DA9|nr:DUF6042 family protein [Brevibacillus sp. SYP-B805]NGQ95564.1 DOPA 4,5-dioxygenase family protein [Brevibacillus sp. SYP-B805]
MQTIRDVRKNKEETVIPTGFTANGWSSILSHEMKVLFQSMCYVVSQYDSKEEMTKALDGIKGLKGTFAKPKKSMFKSEADLEAYKKLLEKHKAFLERSNYTYPASREEAIQLFEKWGLVLDKGEVWDVPIEPFPDVQDLFVLSDAEKFALNHIKLETLVHPVFSRLVLALHEKDDNTFRMSKAEMKELLKTNDAMLAEVLIKLTPYLQEPIENMLDIPDDQKMEFTVVWERIYEDFLGDQYAQTVQ